MTIEISYLITGIVFFVLGIALGWVIGRKIHELNRIKRVLRAKDPELWNLEHYVTVDEDQDKKERKTYRMSNSDTTKISRPSIRK